MGLDFLRNYGGRRVRNYEAQPLLLDDALLSGELPEGTAINLSWECPHDEWHPIDVNEVHVPLDWPLRPMRFIGAPHKLGCYHQVPYP